MKVHPVTHVRRMLPAAVALVSGAVMVGCNEPTHRAEERPTASDTDSSQKNKLSKHIFNILPYNEQWKYLGGSPPHSSKNDAYSQAIPGVIVTTPIPIINPPLNIDIIESEPIPNQSIPFYLQSFP